MCFSEHAFCINLFKCCNWSICPTKWIMRTKKERQRERGWAQMEWERLSVNVLIAITFSFGCENWISWFLIHAIENTALSVSLKHSNKSNISTIRLNICSSVHSFVRSLSPLSCKPSSSTPTVCMPLYTVPPYLELFAVRTFFCVCDGTRRCRRVGR